MNAGHSSTLGIERLKKKWAWFRWLAACFNQHGQAAHCTKRPSLHRGEDCEGRGVRQDHKSRHGYLQNFYRARVQQKSIWLKGWRCPSLTKYGGRMSPSNWTNQELQTRYVIKGISNKMISEIWYFVAHNSIEETNLDSLC